MEYVLPGIAIACLPGVVFGFIAALTKNSSWI